MNPNLSRNRRDLSRGFVRDDCDDVQGSMKKSEDPESEVCWVVLRNSGCLRLVTASVHAASSAFR